MESGLTVAIPTMNRWDGFLEYSLPEYLANPFIQAVVICDENGNDIRAIQQHIGPHPKLILRQNEHRLHAYLNKRQCIELAPTEWVAVLDSDNFFPREFFDTLEKIWKTEGAQPRHFYGAGHILFTDHKQMERTPRGIIIHPGRDTLGGRFSGLLTAANWNASLQVQDWNLMLNDGNWIVPKSALAALPASLPAETVLALDAIVMAKMFVQAGYTYNIRNELAYIHTNHPICYWHETETESMKLFSATDWRL